MRPDFTPSLRPLDVVPVDWQGRPSLVLRDPLGYTEEVLVLPRVLAPILSLMDGRHDLRDLQAAATRTLGRLVMLEEIVSLVEKLESCGFLEGETFRRLREAAEAAWRRTSVRAPACAGRSYPAEARALREFLEGILNREVPPARGNPRVLVAPHLDLSSGARGFAAAYRALSLPRGARVILLGTGHQLAHPLSVLTKDFETPLGPVPVDREAVDLLLSRISEPYPDDYAHRQEHSLEFQVIFLRHLFSDFRVVPVLVGPVEGYLSEGRDPFEAEPLYREWLSALEELWDERTYLILGIDFAHLGLRYGDPFAAGEREGREAVARDRALLEALFSGDYARFLTEARRSLPFRVCGLAALLFTARMLAGRSLRGEIYYQEAVPFGPGSLVSIAAAGLEW